MSHSKNKVWIHGVFSTKYRNPLIIKDVRQVVYDNLHLQLKKSGCFMEAIGGIEDHVHLLFLLNRCKTLSQVFQQVKGASAFEFNQQKLFVEPFHWQKGSWRVFSLGIKSGFSRSVHSKSGRTSQKSRVRCRMAVFVGKTWIAA